MLAVAERGYTTAKSGQRPPFFCRLMSPTADEVVIVALLTANDSLGLRPEVRDVGSSVTVFDFVAAVWPTLAKASAVSARWKVSCLQRKFDELSEELKGLVVAEQRRFLKEINTPKMDEMKRRQKRDAKRSLAA